VIELDVPGWVPATSPHVVLDVNGTRLRRLDPAGLATGALDTARVLVGSIDDALDLLLSHRRWS
jgi:hypothetical protein